MLAFRSGRRDENGRMPRCRNCCATLPGSTFPAAGRSSPRGIGPMSGICARPRAPRSSMSPTRESRASSRRSRCRGTRIRTRCARTATSCWSTTNCSAARPASGPDDFEGGIKVYDTSDKTRPRQIGHYKSLGSHRFDSDGRYAYISSEENGFVGDIVVILDLADPTRPEPIARWWMKGQWAAGGEEATWPGRRHRCHHPLRRGDRLYTSYWHGGFVILDISDLRNPTYVSGLDWSPPYPCPTQRCCRSRTN